MSYKAGFVALLGLPNAGKSTLLNALVGEKISIVTEKAQTTRKRVVGLLTTELGQLILVDPPGVVGASKGLNKFLHDEYKSVLYDADVVAAILNIDQKKFESLEQIIQIARESRKKWFAVITKSDMGKEHRVSHLRKTLEEDGIRVIEVSALKRSKETREKFVEIALDLLPESPAPLYDPELFTTEHVRDMAAEMIREKCFENLYQEVPYGLAVKIIEFDESQEKIIKIYADVLVSRESYKPIIIGKDGSKMKIIGQEAREDIEKLLGKKVYLELKVRVKDNWQKNPHVLKELGYVKESDS